MKNILSSVRRFINTINPDRICVSEIGGLLAENLYAELKPVAAKKMVYLPKTIECLPFGTESIEKNKAITQVVQNCRTIVAASSYVSDYVSDNLNRETYFSYFPLYHPSKERSKYSPESKVTLFNGCLWKGLPVLLQCAEQLRDIKFRVVASWGTTSSDRIEASTYDNVEIVEFNHNVSEYLDASNCVIVPSIIKEAFGQIVIQSMLKGVPVIASTEGGLRESKLGVEWNLPVTPLNNKQKLRKATYKCSDTYVEEWCQKLSIMTSDAQEWTRVSKKSYVAAGAFVKSISWDNIVNTVLT
jgi:glycosyltransferase involved in cell wall biosynthesis